ncbi:MAG: MFS transporter [Haloplanus sp.]
MVTRVGRLLDVAHPRRVLLISGAHGVNEFYSVALPPILPLLVSDLGISYARAGLLVTVYFVMYTVFQLPVGVLADRVSKRSLILVGTVVLAAGMGLAGLADDYPTLVASQVVAGLGGSTYHPSGMSLVSDIEGAETEGKAMGIHGLGGILGTMLAPAVIGGVAALTDWRTALLVSAVVGVGYTLVFLLFFRTPAGFDVDADGGDDADADGGDDDAGASTLRDRLRASVGTLRVVALSGVVAGLAIGKLLFGLQFGAVRTYTTSYIFAHAGESASLANLVFFVLLAGGGVASLWFGSLADRFDRGRLLASTFVVAGVLVLLTVFLPPRTPLLLAWFFLLGVAVYASLPVVNSLVSQHSRRASSGSLFGITQTASALGSATAPLVFGAVATRYSIELAFPAIAAVGFVGGLVLFGFALTVFRG